MIDEQLLAHLVECHRDHRPRRFTRSGLREAAVLVAISEHQGERFLLLTRRSSSMPTHQGEVAFPGGKCEPQDSDYTSTALREAHEEVALLPESVQVIGELDQVISRFGFLVTPVLAVIPHDAELVADHRELDRIFRVPLTFLASDPGEYFQRDGIVMPTWRYNGYCIWGLTAYMIAELMNRYFGSNINVGAVAAAHRDNAEE